jgi:hypothetical protein
MNSTSSYLSSIYSTSTLDFSQTKNISQPSIPYHEIESKSSSNDYTLEWDAGRKTHWVIFRKNESTTEERNKFHISIKRDPSNLEKAFNIIFPLLEKYQIAYFKIIPLKSIEVVGNPLGKEFTIYVQDIEGSKEAQSDFWSSHVLKEIVANLEMEGIEPGEPSTGDIPIRGGKNFIYGRSPFNIFDNYIPAKFLQQLGFSTQESARLSPSSWIDLVIDGYSETEVISNKPLSIASKIFPDLKFEAESIYRKFVDSLTCKINLMGLGPLPKLFYLVAGTDFDVKRIGESKEHKMHKFLFEKTYQANKEWGKDAIYHIVKWEGLDIRITKLATYLKKAAFLSAFKASQNECLLDEVQDIHPAIYHSFVVPLAKKFESGVDESSSVLFNHDEEKKLICHITACALRTQYPELNYADLVDYVDHVDEVDLDIDYRQDNSDDEPSWDLT